MRPFAVVQSLLIAAVVLPGLIGAQESTVRNVRGIHMLAPSSQPEIAMQLHWARLLAGSGGFVTQPFSGIDRTTTSPSDEARTFVAEAYARELNPIVRLQGLFSNQTGCAIASREGWLRPEPDVSTGELSYRSEAEGYRRFVEGLPRVDGRSLYIQVGNEPNLHYMWGGRADPREYARFFVDVAESIRAIGDPRIKILPAGLAPEGDVDNLSFIRETLAADSRFPAHIDYWASHSYPKNRPPDSNLHQGTAPADSRYAVDAYRLELEILAASGVDTSSLGVLLTETGYQLGEQWYPGFPTVTEELRAEYTWRAFELWSNWPEVVAVTPFQLSDRNGSWKPFDWVWPTSRADEHGFPTQPHLLYARQLPGTGVVRGTVRDSTGNRLQGVALSTEAGGHRAESVADGSYVLIAYPGAYELVAEKLGHSPTRVGPLRIVQGGVAELDILLTEQLPTTLQNAGFELGDLSHWTPWGDVDGIQKGPWLYDVMARQRTFFLGTASNCGEKDGGVYQSVAVQPGRLLRASAWAYTHREGEQPVLARIGIDPQGRTDPDGPDIVWSPWVESEGKWTRISVSARAEMGKVTVFLQHDQQAANVWNINAFDGVELVDLPPA